MAIETTVGGKKVRVNMIHKGEKCLMVQFINNEFPKADLEFTFSARRWHFFDGEEYKVPLHVIEHINGLVVPEPRYEQDSNTGQMTRVRITLRHRFTLHPTNLTTLMDEIEDKPKPDKAKEE